MASFGANITDWTGALWPDNRLSGPPCRTVRAGLEVFMRLLDAVVEFGRSVDGAGGTSEGLDVQSPTVLSEDAVRNLEEGACTAMSSTPHLWP